MDNNSWLERSFGLPSDKRVERVSTHLLNGNIAYALIKGWSPMKKIFKTTNRGIHWYNITGDLPDVWLSDLVAHFSDSNKIYIGSLNASKRQTPG